LTRRNIISGESVDGGACGGGETRFGLFASDTLTSHTLGRPSNSEVVLRSCRRGEREVDEVTSPGPGDVEETVDGVLDVAGNLGAVLAARFLVGASCAVFTGLILVVVVIQEVDELLILDSWFLEALFLLFVKRRVVLLLFEVSEMATDSVTTTSILFLSRNDARSNDNKEKDGAKSKDF